MSKFNCKIWNRDFNLDIVFDVYKGESVTELQNEALKKFQDNASVLLESTEEISKYCLKSNKEEIGSNVVDNIFKYVIPQKIFVCRDKTRKIALMCAYKFDVEHGIAIVFENEKFKTIGPQDIIL